MLRRLCALALGATVLVSGTVDAERLQDLANLQGVRGNQLVGYGLVVGLDGTGDQVTQTPFTQQSLINMLSRLGVTVPASNMQLKNVAAAMVTATLPAFARPGQGIDVVVSAMGNAKSLRGGTLLMTPLKGADNQVYAIAQGNILIGGAGASAAGSSVQVNTLNGGRINDGATVERAVPTSIAQDGNIYFELHHTNFGTAENVAAAINRRYPGSASLVDGRVVRVRAPADPSQTPVFVASLEDLEITRAPARARVVINARTGSVVMNQNVTIDEVAVAHGNLSVSINQQNAVSQPNALAGGQTTPVQNASIQVSQGTGPIRRLNSSANLADVVRALNTLGATPQDLLAILQAMKAAGALRADLEII
ncbi:flagellar basal body P-ring protein FlgI [Bordetella sp. FB-8]|uniref:flagellar basal body P-ring protein FlgI n=1 Tax=Bordetella sp. FB-8 TaxID=1159870 RepID=UPI0018C9E91E